MKETIWPEIDKIKAPNLIGKDKQVMIEEMYPFEVEVFGKGEVIIDQSPKPGTLLVPGETIRIYLSSTIE